MLIVISAVSSELAVAELKAAVPGRINVGCRSCTSARNPKVQACPCLARAPENLR